MKYLDKPNSAAAISPLVRNSQESRIAKFKESAFLMALLELQVKLTLDPFRYLSPEIPSSEEAGFLLLTKE